MCITPPSLDLLLAPKHFKYLPIPPSQLILCVLLLLSLFDISSVRRSHLLYYVFP